MRTKEANRLQYMEAWRKLLFHLSRVNLEYFFLKNKPTGIHSALGGFFSVFDSLLLYTFLNIYLQAVFMVFMASLSCSSVLISIFFPLYLYILCLSFNFHGCCLTALVTLAFHLSICVVFLLYGKMFEAELNYHFWSVAGRAGNPVAAVNQAVNAQKDFLYIQ